MGAGAACAPQDVPKRFWLLSIACSVIPDADAIGFSFGIPYGHFLGHRGLFHSPFFGLLLSLFIVGIFFRATATFSRRWWVYAFYFFMLTASHGILDAFTNGGLGIALLSPFDNTRYFFPWTPIQVSPIGARAFFTNRGLMALRSELIWIWLPLVFIVAGSRLVRNFLFQRGGKIVHDRIA